MWRRSRVARWHRDRSLRPTTSKPPNGPRLWPSAKETFCSFATAPGRPNAYELGTGLHPDCLAWLHERRIAVLSSDSDSDVHPPLPGFQRWSEPVHMIAIPYLGLPILDNTDLEEISRACAAERQWEFFVTAAPWRFRSATSSPVNPLAIL